MKKSNIILLLILGLVICLPFESFAQKKKKKKDKEEKVDEKKSALEELSVSGLKFREVGPAFTSGRISDFAVHPDKPWIYYIASSSGGVWKTINSGTTYTPIFDSQGSYSIGCITMDPNNPNVIWVGTGENNNQRSVAYGDGVYKSLDGGASWKHMGLKESEHIGKIIVHPDNSDIIYVAAIGPLWKEGGDRGLYKSTDGGENWEAVLAVDEHTGVTDVVMDPRDPEVLYAATFQRRRHVFTYLGGGPGSGLHKTTDGGKNWVKVQKGLPTVDIGRIGLAISPADPEIIYAVVEAAQGKSGFFRSTNRGASWEKRSSYTSRGNYYQELIADPVDPNTVYSMDTWMDVSHDGGKTFSIVGEDFKHIDNHCMWINPENNKHWLVGCDGGIYETWDAAKTWSFKANLPVTQFYKVSVDNDLPFYNIYGGTQDNFSIGGPSRTNTAHGIMNSDWYITRGGDGFETQVDPSNPDIVFSQSQYGVLFRYDRKSGEELGIQPKERKGENAYRWNWDAPLVASAHKPGRLYYAANKVFRTDDRGNSWEVISDDLTAQINRNELEVMGRIWSFEAIAKNESTSPYGTIVALSESPLNENLIYIGTDDGLIQVTEDGGQNWRKINGIPGVPERTYVNMVYASQHDENVVYACFNHHKYGDFKPYVFKSMDKGVSWQSISSNLPDRGSVYAIEEDHVDADLLFAGTEFSVFFSPNGGAEWKKLSNGVPTIAMRDLAIQKRENDLVLGTFGRGFYVLDDYTALRDIGPAGIAEEAKIFPVRDALLFEYNLPLGLPGKSFQGDNFYTGENLGSEVVFTYFIKEKIKSLKDQRREKEKEEIKEKKNNAYPSYDDLLEERDEIAPQLLFTIADEEGNVVKSITQKPGTGIQRIKWDMRYNSTAPISLVPPSFYNPFTRRDEGTLVKPGKYSISLSKVVDGEITQIAGPEQFNIVPLDNTTLPASNRGAKVAFQKEVSELSRSISAANNKLTEASNKMKHILKAAERAELAPTMVSSDIRAIDKTIKELGRELNGDGIATTLDIDTPPTPATRVGWIVYEQFYSTSDPTETHRMSLGIAKEEFEPILNKINKLVNIDIPALESKLEKAKAPYTPGRDIRMGKQ